MGKNKRHKAVRFLNSHVDIKDAGSKATVFDIVFFFFFFILHVSFLRNVLRALSSEK